MSNPKNVAFLGLGVMGGPMAGHLARAGHQVTVYNRTLRRASEWLARHKREFPGLAMTATPAEAVTGQDVVLTCVGNDDDLREVVFGDDGALAAMREGALFIDHTTVSPGIAREIACAAEGSGVLALDAPVSGGQAGAENGALSIMCGGSEQAMAAAEPIIAAYAARIVHIGGPGAGQSAKMVNQICIGGLLQSLSEAIRFAQASGLDMDRVFEAVSGGAAQSWQMVNRWKTMDEGSFDFGFAVDWMRKDLAIALDEAERLGLAMPVTELVDRFYAEIQEMGGGRQDTSSLIRLLPKGANA
ncbi:MAG TPA: NAD(P)-dependent oxidoreductase [Sphingomonadaceae bacterium]|nr:NAD(P)-dependent oxidoreductase [Sphingomonadaceae bacterium]